MTDATAAPGAGGPNVKPIAESVDPRLASTRDTLLGCSVMGFVGCVVIGIKPKSAGFTVIGSSELRGMETVAALEMAKQDLIAMLRRGQGLPT